ncbi:hypothetical protein PM076_03485 [Halorubrum ezzemoulense]|uniref:Uncharacterized protein n=1 Tax=Halorubrum ezzemoulense TaxID=337243 RepID=A0ABT4Z1I3_HALEZ|nr:hypothetical protein [Halorubrum ezzemoulense]MDB2244508.1 hypothetical protein [Halorubrum ezzemoulense]MDB2278735.1 hypothetical protein [Halorubrum ezzemoulense]MDB2285797.1 hypothetical protein [Halorubrum ezzemoulense]MDB2287842.1 hypothetical protein [Halorubrum ezzemoulense]MDB2291967.1 hypothetical protein [Halorubrum ezzemoulense]
MADDDQTTLGDEEQSFLLSGTSSLDGVDFRAATGIDASNLSRSVVGTIGFALAAAATLFVQGVTEAWTRLINGLADFLGGTQELVTGVASNLAPGAVYRDVPGLIGTLADGWVSAMEGAWSSALPDSGIVAWLFALSLVLLTFYAAARGLDTVSEVLE